MQTPAVTVTRARRLRRSMSPPEVRLWVQLRRRLQGLRFRRQHPVGPFVLDFYCDAARLAVEVDGEHHTLGCAPLHDIERDDWLALRGIRVLRVPASLVLADMDTTLRTIAAAATDESRRSNNPPHP